MAHHRNGQPGGRLGGDADMDGGVAVDDAGMVVESGVDAGLLGDGLYQRAHQERQDRELGLLGLAVAVHRRAQILERRHSTSST